MAISINIQMTRREWAEFADWLDERYSPSCWRFYGRSVENHAKTRESLPHYGDPDSYVRNAVVLDVEDESHEFTLIKMFHGSASVINATDTEAE